MRHRTPEADRRVLAAVLACPDRGTVLPHTLQPECGCAELTACAAGRGNDARGATLEECVRCRYEALAPPAQSGQADGLIQPDRTADASGG